MSPPLIDFTRISVARGDATVLHDITLRIGVGEHVAILGPNGCGKSTLIKTITRECYPLRHPASSLAILGEAAWHLLDLRRQLGIVTHDLLLHATDGLTGFELVVSSFFSSVGIWRLRQQITPEMEVSALHALDRMEARHLADREVGAMSSGEARRVQIARALVHRPLALLTHHLGDIIPEVDRIIFLRGGRVIEDGPKQSLLTTDRLSALFGVQVAVAERDGYYHAW